MSVPQFGFLSSKPLSLPIIFWWGELQSQIAKVVPGRLYIYDLVEQQTCFASCSVLQLLGYDNATIAHLDLEGLANLIHPSDLDQIARYYQHLTTLRLGEITTIEYRMRRVDGTWCWLRSQETPWTEAICPIGLTNDAPTQILGFVQDLTNSAANHSTRFTWLNSSIQHSGVTLKQVLEATQLPLPNSQLNSLPPRL
jgi:PAS domain-containing protein